MTMTVTMTVINDHNNEKYGCGGEGEGNIVIQVYMQISHVSTNQNICNYYHATCVKRVIWKIEFQLF